MMFHDPGYLLFVALIPLWLIGKRTFLQPASVGFSNVGLVKRAVGSGGIRPGAVMTFMRCAGFFLMALALAGPQMERKEVVLKSEGLDMFLIVDVSSSMSDRSLDEDRSNLEAAVEVMKGFARSRSNDRLGLISFARFPELVCPLTTDREAVVSFLDGLACVPQGSDMDGTAIGAALGEASRRFASLDDGGKRSGEEGAGKVVVLVTDGEENRFTLDPVKAAGLLDQLDVKAYTVAVFSGGIDSEASEGAGAGRPISTKVQEAVARITGGEFARASSYHDLNGIYEKIDELEKRPVERRHFTEREELFRWLLLPGAFLILVEFILRKTVFVRIP